MTKRPDFTTTATHLSNDALCDFAEGKKKWEAAIAKSEMRERVRRGDVHDLAFDRAAKILNLA